VQTSFEPALTDASFAPGSSRLLRMLESTESESKSKGIDGNAGGVTVGLGGTLFAGEDCAVVGLAIVGLELVGLVLAGLVPLGVGVIEDGLFVLAGAWFPLMVSPVTVESGRNPTPDSAAARTICGVSLVRAFPLDFSSILNASAAGTLAWLESLLRSLPPQPPKLAQKINDNVNIENLEG
jgi:hypothetical protein